MVFPFKDIEKCRLTSAFGKIRSDGRPHYGVDLVSDGDPMVISVSAGKVIRSRYTAGGWGQHVVVQMSDGRALIYGHLVKDSQRVVVGDIVKVGQIIGTMGNTGHSSGPHLHIELQKKYYKPGDTDDITVFLNVKNIEGKVQPLEEGEDMQTQGIMIQVPGGAVLTVDGYIVNGTSYAPLREVLEKLGFKVGWKDGKITVSR